MRCVPETSRSCWLMFFLLLHPSRLLYDWFKSYQLNLYESRFGSEFYLVVMATLSMGAVPWRQWSRLYMGISSCLAILAEAGWEIAAHHFSQTAVSRQTLADVIRESVESVWPRVLGVPFAPFSLFNRIRNPGVRENMTDWLMFAKVSLGLSALRINSQQYAMLDDSFEIEKWKSYIHYDGLLILSCQGFHSRVRTPHSRLKNGLKMVKMTFLPIVY